MPIHLFENRSSCNVLIKNELKIFFKIIHDMEEHILELETMLRNQKTVSKKIILEMKTKLEGTQV